MAKQLTIQFQLFGEIAPNDLDQMAYDMSVQIQSKIPCRVLGYGVIDVLSPMPTTFTITGQPGIVDATIEQSAAIHMGG